MYVNYQVWCKELSNSSCSSVQFTSVWHQTQLSVSSETVYFIFALHNNTKNKQAVPAVATPNSPQPPNHPPYLHT